MAAKTTVEALHRTKVQTYLLAGKTRSQAEDQAATDLGLHSSVAAAFQENARSERQSSDVLAMCLRLRVDNSKII